MPQYMYRGHSTAYWEASGTIEAIMSDELAEHLNALARDDCYRVDAVLKNGPFETTQRVFFVGANGAEQGPYVRKYLDGDAGLGAAYERIWKAQREGRRFLHLPRVVDCYVAGEQRAVVMEHVQGETLADVVYRCDPSVELACDVFPRLCEAVGELHEGFDPPIIHRDLKPSNIMLSRDSLTIIDFGISRTFDSAADEDTRRFGTRAYAPPEQFGYGQTDVRSDIYALGMLLYFCLTEKTPDAKVRQDDFRDPYIPEVFRQVIMRATSFDPAGRYANVAELKRAFLLAVDTLAPRVFQPVMTDDRCELDKQTRMASKSVSDSQRVREKPSSFGLLLSRVPFAVGVVWDVVLVLVFALFCIVAVNSTIDPSAGSEQYAAAPLWLRGISYGSLVLLIIGPVLFLVSDRRPLSRIVPALSHVSIERDMAVCFVVFLVGLVLFMFTGQLFIVE